MDLRTQDLWYGTVGGFIYPKNTLSRTVDAYKPIPLPIRESMGILSHKKKSAAEAIFYGLALPQRTHVRFNKSIRNDLIGMSAKNHNLNRNILFVSRDVCMNMCKEVRLSNELDTSTLFQFPYHPYLDRMIPFDVSSLRLFGCRIINKSDTIDPFEAAEKLVDYTLSTTEYYNKCYAKHNEPKNRNILYMIKQLWLGVYKMRRMLPISKVTIGAAIMEMLAYYMDLVGNQGRSVSDRGPMILASCDFEVLSTLPKFNWHKTSRSQLQKSKEDTPLAPHSYPNWNHDFYHDYELMVDYLSPGGGSLLMRHFKGGIGLGIYNLFTTTIDRSIGRSSTAFNEAIFTATLAESLWESTKGNKNAVIEAFNALVYPLDRFQNQIFGDFGVFASLREDNDEVDEYPSGQNEDPQLYDRLNTYRQNYRDEYTMSKLKEKETNICNIAELKELYFAVYIEPCLSHKYPHFRSHKNRIPFRYENFIFNLQIREYIAMREMCTALAVLYHWARKNKELLKQEDCLLRIKLWQLVTQISRSFDFYRDWLLEEDINGILGISIKQYHEFNNTGFLNYTTNLHALHNTITSIYNVVNFKYERKHGSVAPIRFSTCTPLFDVNHWVISNFGDLLYTYNRKDNQHDIEGMYHDTLLTLLSTL